MKEIGTLACCMLHYRTRCFGLCSSTVDQAGASGRLSRPCEVACASILISASSSKLIHSSKQTISISCRPVSLSNPLLSKISKRVLSTSILTSDWRVSRSTRTASRSNSLSKFSARIGVSLFRALKIVFRKDFIRDAHSKVASGQCVLRACKRSKGQVQT
ncbi:hypothetical protein BCV69DRAFT_44455 [Microstroma glucosiphilum]|uniref:Uncharacterized protein n=1 Tax=Pseudomicrostroma glucosiphilum TaxID=1684307 RepID=A0A316U133_9BASI|nr:hypothetical protein BCV69DRAFT_44455 [Pseudomicrostroma glucosiphilum]PWN19099.1 hypothetical protein BCV69DRAFT_44455 [Pseudomicrostroma glucosiphilum]